MNKNQQQPQSASNRLPGYIAIEGCIGVGKTTLCKKLAARFNAKEILEKVEENPFLSDFYQNPTLYAFKTQIFFLLSRYKQEQELKQRELFSERIVSDYFIVKDRIFADLTLSESEMALYEQLFQTLCVNVQAPDIIIYLRAPIELILERIRRRGRTFEKTIDPGYLINLIKSYDNYFAKYTASPLLIIDTEELNFPEREQDVTYVVDAIGETIGQGKLQNLVTAGDVKQTLLFS